jgi:predicted metal-dependent peptidase
MNTQEAMLAARLARPYYAKALAALHIVESETVPTMGVDKYWRLYINPKFLDTLTLEHAANIIAAHEVEHLLRDHCGRAERISVDHQRWNTAADCEINDDLKATDLPEGGVFPSTFGLPNDLLAEEYYQQLPSNLQQQSPEGSGAGAPAPWELPDEDAPAIPQEAAEALREAVAADVREHVRSNPGSVPKGVQVWADARAARHKMDWRRVLSHFVGRALAPARGRQDFSYSRLNRRSAYLPTLRPGTIKYQPNVVILADTSGSMDEEGAKVLGVVEAVLKTTQAKVISCDTKAQLTRGKRFVGGGGTDMTSGFKLAGKLKADVLIVITDTELVWPEKPSYPVIIVKTQEGETPSWAKAVLYE